MNLNSANNLVNYYNDHLVERQRMLQEALASLENNLSISFGGVPRFYSEHPDYHILYVANKEVLTNRLLLITQEIAQLEVTYDKNLPEIVEYFGTNPRKVFANEYWDDRTIHMSHLRHPDHKEAHGE